MMNRAQHFHNCGVFAPAYLINNNQLLLEGKGLSTLWI